MRRVLLFCLCLGALPSPALAAPYTLIVCGSGGEEAYSERFADWGTRLRRVLIDSCAHVDDRVVLLTETGEGDGVTAASTRETVLSRLRELGVRVRSGDDLYLYLIGHGSYRRGEARLNVPGPDLSARDLALTFDGIEAARIVIVNTASSSAPFVNALSRPGRIVVAATRSHEQANATQFAGSLVETLESGTADVNRDGRVSVEEAARQAAAVTERWYAEKKWVATENAILDDDGDGRGSRLYKKEGQPEGSDGALAKRTYIRDITYPDHVPGEWIAAYRAAIDTVEAWIARKADLDSAAYYARLESLLLDAARANRRIREAENANTEDVKM